MTDVNQTFQLSLEAAEMYEQRFVPALFAEWAPLMIDAAGVEPDHDVIDVACGTGVVARGVADLQQGRGSVVGIDVNEAMLAVAARVRPDITWQPGDATDIPAPDAAFDRALCQAALMFFPDRAKALREMARVVRPEGIIAVQVWASLDEQPAYGPLVDVVVQHAGPDAFDLMSAYWTLGDMALTRSLFEAARLDIGETRTHLGTAKFPSIDAVVRTEIDATPLADRIDGDTYDAILVDARRTLGEFDNGDGANIPIRGHILVASKLA